MKTILGQYFRAEVFDDACRTQMRGSVAEFTRACGLYLTASEFLKAVDAYARNDAAAFAERKAYASEIAGDLFLDHLEEELRATAKGERPLGPNVFDDYCREVIDPYFRSGRPLRAIEAIVPVAEEMVLRGIFAAPRREAYLALAEQAAHTLLNLAVSKQERDMQSTHMALRLEKKGATPPPVLARSKGPVSNELMAYLRDLKSAMEGFRETLARFSAESPLSIEHLGTTTDAGQIRNQGRFLLSVCEAIKESKHLPIQARLGGHIAGLRERIQPGAGQESFRRSAGMWESAASVEHRIGLQGLAFARMKEANDLAKYIEDDAERARIVAKYSGLKTG